MNAPTPDPMLRMTPQKASQRMVAADAKTLREGPWTAADDIWSRVDAGDLEGAQRILREYGAAVLNDAANDWQSGEWADAPRRADRVQERIANGQYVGDWLRDRAARQTTVTERPTT